MHFSHDPVFDAPLRKIESLTQKFGKTESPDFCGVQLLIIGHSEIMNRASASSAKHEKSVSAVKFTISVFSVVTVRLYSTWTHDSLQCAHTHALLRVHHRSDDCCDRWSDDSGARLGLCALGTTRSS